MYLGEIMYDIELNPTFWDNVKIKNIPFEHFITVFNKNLITSPSYIPHEDIKNWIDELIIKCHFYYDFI